MPASTASLRTKLKRLEALADQRCAARCPLEDQATPEKLLCENSLYEFVKLAWPHIEPAPFLDNWHIGALCEHLQAVTRGQIMKLLVNIPPGMSKSLLVSVFWPMWEWATHPEIRWFYASYDQRLSTRDSVRCRALLESRWYQLFWPLRLKGDQNQKTYYETAQGGYRLATSIGGHGTGEHPHRIVVDDPNSVQQAESEAARREVQEWWTLTMPTRGVTLNARRVCIQQRTHQEDFSGMAFREGGWTAIVLPMRYEKERMEPTPLGWNDPRTEEGDLLAPRQFDESRVAAMEKSLRLIHGNYGVAGQLQQHPVPKEGGMFKRPWFDKTLNAAPLSGLRVRYWDKAATASGGDWTVGILMGKTPQGVFFVEDMVRGQWSAHERNVVMKQTAQKDAAKYGGLVTIWIEQEGTAGGKESAEWSVKDLAGYTVRVEPAVSAKDIRAEPLAAQAEAGNVVLIEGAWNGPFLDELCAFPNGKNDDIVDAASGAFNKLALGFSLFGPEDRAASISSKIPVFVPQTRGIAVSPKCLGG